MRFIGDFHIHSHFSLATSSELSPEFLDYWARLKGIKVTGIGDFTHPAWIKELKEKTEPAEKGLYKLKSEFKKQIPFNIPNIDNNVRFILTAEISCIYKKNGKVRKVHNLIFAPDFDIVEKIQQQLFRHNFNITSDGRPILGMDSRDLLELILNVSDDIFFVPAHIWTPWFSVLGDKSGFDSIDECFGDMSDNIYAVEMGLSSDPPMNWSCSILDKYTLIANSDAHSPEKLGRNANLFNTEISYNAIIDAMKTGDPRQFMGTVNFFPQEGKYHYDGHRKCNVCWSPLETMKNKEICKVCGKKITVGVMNRVAQLSDRSNIFERQNRNPFYSLIPLKEILSEIIRKGESSKEVIKTYNLLLQKLGSEFDILLHLPTDDIRKAGNDTIAEAVRRMRNREVYIKEGFDGEFGIIKVMHGDEKTLLKTQDSLFIETATQKSNKVIPGELISFDLEEYRKLKSVTKLREPDAVYEKKTGDFPELNPEQQKAVGHYECPSIIIAGPGTGKTKVLTHRIVHLINERSVLPENILAITFTNKASGEIKERVTSLIKNNKLSSKINISTFHAFGLSVLKELLLYAGRKEGFYVIDETYKEQILINRCRCDKKQVKVVLDKISDIKQKCLSADEIADNEVVQFFENYQMILKEINAFDLDDLIYYPVKIFHEFSDVLDKYRKKYEWIMIDEYQDINFAQYTLIRLLMHDHSSNLCVIGDPNQAIYGFRGADVRFIKMFLDDFPGASVYQLTKSYRCSDMILRASEDIINNNFSSPGILKGLQKGVKINISKHPTDKSEAEFVARTIEKMIGGLRFFSIDSKISEGEGDVEIRSLSDFAVLCRTKNQFGVIEKAFNDHSIPFQSIGDSFLLAQEPVRNIIEALRFAFLKSKKIPLEEIFSIKTNRNEIINFLPDFYNNISVKEALILIIDTVYKNEKNKENKNLFSKLLAIAENYGNDMENFLDYAVLGKDVDTHKYNIEKVSLMTLHAAKGLEFKCVFITGCEDGLLPYNIYENYSSDLDEEKRLLYVGMTRAEKFLFLSHAGKRYIYGREYNLNRSPFLNSIEKELVDFETAERKKINKEENQLSLF